MTKDIETVILPKCERCKTVIDNPVLGYVVVGDIYTAELDEDGQPHEGLVGASFPSVDDCPIGANGAMFTHDQVKKHCFCQNCMMEILKIPHRPIPRDFFSPESVTLTPKMGPGVPRDARSDMADHCEQPFSHPMSEDQ